MSICIIRRKHSWTLTRSSTILPLNWSPEKGGRVVSGLLSAARKISGHATRFPPVGPLPFTTDEYRFSQVGDYVIFFRAEGEAVYVDRILYNRRDFYMLLGRRWMRGAARMI